MLDKENEIIETFRKVIPKMSTIEKEKLLSFGEGMAFKFSQMDHEQADQKTELVQK